MLNQFTTPYPQVESTVKSPTQHAGRAGVARMHSKPRRRMLEALSDTKATTFRDDALVDLGMPGMRPDAYLGQLRDE